MTGGGLSLELLHPTFAIGLQDVQESKVDDVEALVLNQLQQIAKDGFSPERVHASLNSIKFRLRQFSSQGGMPRGLSLMLAALPGWMYGSDPIERMRYAKAVEALEAR